MLVVDDEPAIRALVAKIIERSGRAVDTARDGADAIAKLETDSYAVLVLDLMMPNVDGYAVLDYLRARNRERPAIIVVSASDSAALRRLDGAMVHSILRKPFDIDVLGDLVNAAAESIDESRSDGDVLPFRRDIG